MAGDSGRYWGGSEPRRRRAALQRKIACDAPHRVARDGNENNDEEINAPHRIADRGEDFPAPPLVKKVLQSPGQPIDAEARAAMESHFGHDFSRVRIHADQRAAQSAHAVGARAFTVGNEIVFAPGQYTPHTLAGQKLLAHELAHVIQQQGVADHAQGPQESLTVGAPDDDFEQQADLIADSVMHSSVTPAPIRAGSGGERASTIAGLTYDAKAGQVLRRVVNYLRQLDPSESQPFLEAFDRSVSSIERDLQNPHIPVAEDIRQAATILRSMRREGRVTCWETSGGLNYASYDSASRQLRLHVVFRGHATNPATLLHEAIHALHAADYPGLSRMYGESLARGGTTDTRRGILLLKWKAWTEYWAYRRTVEFDNARQTEPAFRRDAHLVSMAERDVRESVQAVRAERGEENFDPQTWTPPAEYLARPAHGSSQRPRNP
jgi:hypothetical protein